MHFSLEESYLTDCVHINLISHCHFDQMIKRHHIFFPEGYNLLIYLLAYVFMSFIPQQTLNAERINQVDKYIVSFLVRYLAVSTLCNHFFATRKTSDRHSSGTMHKN